MEWLLRGLGTLGAGLLLTATSGCASEKAAGCAVQFSVYDARGTPLDFRVSAATRADNETVNLLGTSSGRGMRASGDSLYYPATAVNGLRIRATLESADGRRIKKDIPLLACQQRATVRYGQSDSGADVFISSAEGHLTGCTLKGDWWVRSMPMFGTPDDSTAVQGYVRREDGFFRVDFPAGERLIVVVGKDKTPVKVFAVDVTAGKKNDLGKVDLSGSCPK